MRIERRRSMWWGGPWVLLGVLWIGFSTSGCIEIAGKTNPIDPLAHLRVLADDAMEGRGLGQLGLERAIDYAQLVMFQAGLEPAFVLPDGSGTYQQEVPVVRYRFSGGSQAVVESRGDSTIFVHADGMFVGRPGAESTVTGGSLVFVGYGINEPELGRDDYSGVDVHGKWAILLEGRPDNMTPELAAIYSNVDRSGDRIVAAARESGAIGLVVVLDAQAYAAWNQIVDMYRDEVFVALRRYIFGSQADTDILVVVMGPEGIAALFAGSGCDPISRRNVESSFELPDARLTVTTNVERSTVVSHNLAGILRGNRSPDEYVAFTAHIDHLGNRDGEIHNGANDDASGCAVVLAAAHRLQREELSRSVMFVLFTGEETGHFGSLHFLADPPPGTIVAGLNLEHVGRSGDGTFLTTASTELLAGMEAVAASSAGLMRTAKLDGFGGVIRGSDSYSFFLHDIPTVIMGGGTFPEYHTPGDDVELIDAGLLDQAVDLSIAMVRRLAGGRTREPFSIPDLTACRSKLGSSK